MLKHFAYGSNCNPQVMRRKGVEFASRRRAVLRGYRLFFNKMSLRDYLPNDIGYANIGEEPQSAVEGVMYEIYPEHLDVLDSSERYPSHYGRVEVEVETEDGACRCFAYQAHADKICDGLAPTRAYLDHILAAGDLFSPAYLEVLRRSPTHQALCAMCGRLDEAFFAEDRRLQALCQVCHDAKTK